MSLANVVAYSVQLAALVLVAAAACHVLRLRAPRPSLRFWQITLAAALVLPWLQPSAPGLQAGTLMQSSTAIVTASAPVTALAGRGIDVTQWVLVALAAGIAARLLWLAAGLLRLRAIVRRTTPAPELQPLADELKAAIGADATLALTDDIHTPATVGVRRAVVLLPRRVLEMPSAVQRAVIAHELVHVKRRDWLHTLGEEFWCAALWFHPAARVIATRLSLARETIVDEATIRLTRDRRAYAEALLAFSDPQPHVIGLTPLIGRRSLSQRIGLIAQEEVMSRSRVLAGFALALLLATTATSAAVTMFPLTGAAQSTTVHKPGNGVSLPVPTREAKADYTPAAMQRGIQGSVFMEVVVLATGDVGDVTITQSLDKEYGLDEAAVAAMKLWKFEPAKKDGKPVAVEVTIEMSFRLK